MVECDYVYISMSCNSGDEYQILPTITTLPSNYDQRTGDGDMLNIPLCVSGLLQ